MTKIIILLLVLSFQTGFTQELSETEKLSSLCKIWGFLKYYHPEAASGKLQWDQQLIDMIPKVEHAKNTEDLSLCYLRWIESLGNVKEKKSTLNSGTFDKNFDLSWFGDHRLYSTELTNKLQFIEKNRFQGSHYFLRTKSAGNIEIKNEIQYDDFDFPTTNYRLLSLFRYWNTVEYFFPIQISDKPKLE